MEGHSANSLLLPQPRSGEQLRTAKSLTRDESRRGLQLQLLKHREESLLVPLLLIRDGMKRVGAPRMRQIRSHLGNRMVGPKEAIA